MCESIVPGSLDPSRVAAARNRLALAPRSNCISLLAGLALFSASLNAADASEPGLLDQKPNEGLLSFEGGVALTQNTVIRDSESSTKFSFDTGMRFDIRGGATFTSGWGFDLDFGVIYSPFKGNPLSTDIGNLDFYEIPIMLD